VLCGKNDVPSSVAKIAAGRHSFLAGTPMAADEHG
jgi:hypothetical protein